MLNGGTETGIDRPGCTQTLYHASWRISRPTTIEPEPQADIVPTGEVRAAISSRFTSSTEPQTRLFWG